MVMLEVFIKVHFARCTLSLIKKLASYSFKTYLFSYCVILMVMINKNGYTVHQLNLLDMSLVTF